MLAGMIHWFPPFWESDKKKRCPRPARQTFWGKVQGMQFCRRLPGGVSKPDLVSPEPCGHMGEVLPSQRGWKLKSQACQTGLTMKLIGKKLYDLAWGVEGRQKKSKKAYWEGFFHCFETKMTQKWEFPLKRIYQQPCEIVFLFKVLNSGKAKAGV